MKNFKSVGTYITESVGAGREVTFVVENDMDRNHLSENDRWTDLMSGVMIDDRKFSVRNIHGKSSMFPEPEDFNKGTYIGISIMREIK